MKRRQLSVTLTFNLLPCRWPWKRVHFSGPVLQVGQFFLKPVEPSVLLFPCETCLGVSWHSKEEERQLCIVDVFQWPLWWIHRIALVGSFSSYLKCHCAQIPESTCKEQLLWILLNGTYIFQSYFYPFNEFPWRKRGLKSLWNFTNSRFVWAAKHLVSMNWPSSFILQGLTILPGLPVLFLHIHIKF